MILENKKYPVWFSNLSSYKGKCMLATFQYKPSSNIAFGQCIFDSHIKHTRIKIKTKKWYTFTLFLK